METVSYLSAKYIKGNLSNNTLYYTLLNLTRMRELFFIIYSDLLFITPIFYFILSILILFPYQVLLASLLRVINSVNSCSIVLNLTKLFSISTGIKESPGNVIVKDIKGLLLLKPRLLKLKVSNRNLLKIKKLTLTQLLLLVYMH